MNFCFSEDIVVYPRWNCEDETTTKHIMVGANELVDFQIVMDDLIT